MNEFDSDFEPDDDFESFQMVDYKELTPEHMHQEYYLCRYFLETSKNFNNVFDWLVWVDIDTLAYIQEGFSALEKELEESSLIEKYESNLSAEDYSLFCVLCFSKQYPNRDIDEEDMTLAYNIMNIGSGTVSLMKRDIVKIKNYGDGDIFGDKLSFIRQKGKEE